MNLSSGLPLWFIRNGLLYDYPKLAIHSRADVVVIGGGISGALTAYQLQRSGVDVMVVDGRTIGLGSTCASTSLLQYELDIPLFRLREKIGVEKASRAYQRCVQAVDELCAVSKEIGFAGFRKTKSIYYAASDKHIPLLLQEMDARKSVGIDIHWLSAGQLRDVYGIEAPAALLSRPSAQTDAYLFTHAIHQANIKAGVKVYDRTFISRTERSGKGFLLTTEDGYQVRCKKLVYANGYEATGYINKKIVRLSSTYAIASEQYCGSLPLLQKNVLVWSTADPYLYMRTTEDNRLVVGGRDEDFRSAGKRDKLIHHKGKLLVRDVEKVLPGISFKQEFAWCGTFGSTKDSLPYIGNYPGRPGIYFALGFGGNGITFSHIAAQIVAAMISGKKQVRDAGLFSFER